MPDFSQFAQSLTDAGKSSRTVASYITDLLLFATWFHHTNGDDLTPAAVTPSDLRDYKQYLVTVERARPATINRKLAALRSWLAYCLEAGLIDVDPAAKVKGVKEQEPGPRWLTKQEQFKLIRALEKERQAARTDPARAQAARDTAIVFLMLHAGLRVGEVCALELTDLELSERKGSVRVRQGKGEKERNVPLNQSARAALRGWLEVRPENGHHLFFGKTGKPLGEKGVQDRLRYYAMIIGAEDLTPHVLRHTFAKNLIDSGVGIERVADLLGHSVLETTRRYTKPSQGDLQRAVDQLDL